MEKEKNILLEDDVCDCTELTECEELPFDEELTCKEKFTQKCQEVKDACNKTVARIVDDWKETAGNPYIRQTNITKIEIFRSPEDETPVDVFQTTNVRSYSARAMALVGTAALAFTCATKFVAWKIAKKF
ncbi:MAG: hypothetical protein IIX80_04460 [Clostridia bacterium]|nr:hypothetical protein [Clostridia bacterium]